MNRRLEKLKRECLLSVNSQIILHFHKLFLKFIRLQGFISVHFICARTHVSTRVCVCVSTCIHTYMIFIYSLFRKIE